MGRLGVFTIVFAFVLTACNRNPETSADAGQMELIEAPSRLTVVVDNLRLRKKPGIEGEIVTTIPKGAQLVDLGEVSDFTTKVVLRSIEYDEPWLKVRFRDSLEGWVFAGAVNFDMQHPSEIGTLLVRKRLLNLFGEKWTQKIEQYRQQYFAAQRSREFADAYRTGQDLKDTLNHLLESTFQFSDFALAPDLFWLKEPIPAFQPQLVAEGTMYYLFNDYEIHLQKASQTTGDEDDEFIELCLQLFPTDSIEYFYPAWFIQTWDYGGHSLLGRGIHLQILEEMDEVLEANDIFEPEILAIKSRLLADILDPDNSYWESQENILTELNQIITGDLKVLSEEDKSAVQLRRDMFKNPAENGIELNFRSGIGNF